MTFGQKLKQARKDKGLTQKQLADIIEVKHNSVSNWENDQNKPDLDTVRRICTALDVNLGYLFDEELAVGADSGELSRMLSKTEFALFDAVRQLSEEDKLDILEFVMFKAEKKDKRGGS